MDKYRVVEHLEAGRPPRYYAQHRPRWWPFWFYARENDYPDPDILEFRSKPEAVEWCVKHSRHFSWESYHPVDPTTHPTQEADK